MAENKKSFSIDWLLQGTLAKFGDIFDRLTGRGWKPSSSLATSELIERLKRLLDSEVKDLKEKGKFVPHNINLKMQWDKFSTDAEDALKTLENELMVAAIDHINDKRYHTYEPIKLEIKPDYFTEGVKLMASFGKFAEEEREDAAMNVTVPDLKNIIIALPEIAEPVEEKETYVAEFYINDKPRMTKLEFKNGQRLSVGRTKENALSLDDTSVSKIHAALVLNAEKQLMVADTGSTNGTFINDKRIAYGKAYPISDGDKLKFGMVEVAIRYVPKEVEQESDEPEEISQTANILPPADFSQTANVAQESDFSQTAVIPTDSQAEEIPVKQSSQPTESFSTSENAANGDTTSPTAPRVVIDFDKQQ